MLMGASERSRHGHVRCALRAPVRSSQDRTIGAYARHAQAVEDPSLAKRRRRVGSVCSTGPWTPRRRPAARSRCSKCGCRGAHGAPAHAGLLAVKGLLERQRARPSYSAPGSSCTRRPAGRGRAPGAPTRPIVVPPLSRRLVAPFIRRAPHRARASRLRAVRSPKWPMHRSIGVFSRCPACPVLQPDGIPFGAVEPTRRRGGGDTAGSAEPGL